MANVYSDEAVAELRQMFREFESRMRNTLGPRARYNGSTSQIREGILDDALAVSTGSGQTESTATMSIWTGVGDDWADSDDNLTVTNRSDDTSASSGVYISVYRINGEWRPIWVDC